MRTHNGLEGGGTTCEVDTDLHSQATSLGRKAYHSCIESIETFSAFRGLSWVGLGRGMHERTGDPPGWLELSWCPGVHEGILLEHSICAER